MPLKSAITQKSMQEQQKSSGLKSAIEIKPSPLKGAITLETLQQKAEQPAPVASLPVIPQSAPVPTSSGGTSMPFLYKPPDLSKANWYTRLLTAFWQFYGIEDRPDLQLFFSILTVTAFVLCIVYLCRKWDDKFGYFSALKTKFKVLKKIGFHDVFNFKKPMNPSQLETYFDRVKAAANLDRTEIWNIKRLANSRMAHDAYFRLRPFYKNSIGSVNLATARVQVMIIGAIVMQILPIFLLLYICWFIVRYWKLLWVPLFHFFIDVLLKYCVTYALWWVGETIGRSINSAISGATLGVVKHVIPDFPPPPTFSSLYQIWLMKYMYPALNSINGEYSCYLTETADAVDTVLAPVMVPAQMMYKWYVKLKAYGLDAPFDEFSKIVSEAYVKFIDSNRAFEDNISSLNQRFYSILKSVMRSKGKIKSTKVQSPAIKKAAAKPKLLNLKTSQKHEPTDVCHAEIK